MSVGSLSSAADAKTLQHEFGESAKHFTDTDILRAASFLKLKAKLVKSDIQRLKDVALPAIAKDKNGKYFILGRIDSENENENERDRPRLQAV